MPTSIFLAKLIGPLALVVGIGLFLNKSGFRAIAEEFLRSPALIYLSGFMTMAAGLAIVLTHNVWVADWPVIVTVLGWLTTIAGALRILIPDKLDDFGRRMLRSASTMVIVGGIWLGFGAVLTYFGYVSR